jgi:pimeloyl-ACP methyl ester carboxylesterase
MHARKRGILIAIKARRAQDWHLSRAGRRGHGMNRRHFIGLGAAALAGTATILPVGASYRNAVAAARRRVSVPTHSAPTRFGACQWADAGTGAPALMLHGTGGGFDQGLLFSRRLSEAGWRVIAPSRFGYLGSDMPADPSPANQADALADLLDNLGVAQLPVIGGSAGAISAIEFAILHPDRCSALVALVPATHVPGRPPVRPGALGAAITRHAL